jgi:hypothetical protein
MARFIGARGRGPWAGANRCQIDSVLPQMLGFVPARKMRARAWIAANLVGWLVGRAGGSRARCTPSIPAKHVALGVRCKRNQHT